MTCINHYQESKNQVILVKHDRWIMCGHSYMIAYKNLSLDYKAELLYYHKVEHLMLFLLVVIMV